MSTFFPMSAGTRQRIMSALESRPEGAAVFDDLVELDRNGLAQQAALWSMAQMQAIGRNPQRTKP